MILPNKLIDYVYKLGAIKISHDSWVVAEPEDYIACSNEQKFKTKFIKRHLSGKHCKAFCIETEETYGGFPDVLVTSKEGNINEPTMCTFFEFKISDMSGAITFKPTQPAFYKKYSYLDIFVIAYNRKSNKVHVFSVDEIRDTRSMYYTEGKARINLSKVEREAGIR